MLDNFVYHDLEDMLVKHVRRPSERRNGFRMPIIAASKRWLLA